MERTPDLYAYLTGVYTPMRGLQFTATGTFTGPMLVYHNGDEIQKVTTPSFLDLSLKASYTIPFGESTLLELSLGVRNLFNSYQHDLDSGPERDAAYIYGPSLPRTIFAGAKLAI